MTPPLPQHGCLALTFGNLSSVSLLLDATHLKFSFVSAPYSVFQLGHLSFKVVKYRTQRECSVLYLTHREGSRLLL